MAFSGAGWDWRPTNVGHEGRRTVVAVEATVTRPGKLEEHWTSLIRPEVLKHFLSNPAYPGLRLDDTTKDFVNVSEADRSIVARVSFVS
jgi:hypothetical protein